MTQYGDLNASERDVLCALSDGEILSGGGVKDRVNSQGHISRFALYNSLNKLEEKGLVNRYAEYFDGRTNGYQLTDAGIETLADRRDWEMECDADDVAPNGNQQERNP